MSDDAWVVTLTYNVDEDLTVDAMDYIEDQLEHFDGSVSRVPGRGIDVIVYAPAGMDMLDAGAKMIIEVGHLVPGRQIGVEVLSELAHRRRAQAPTLPELMSAAEIAETLGVARQRVHQLRSTTAFPAPLAELRGGAVWNAAAVRKFKAEWSRKPGRPKAFISGGNPADRR